MKQILFDKEPTHIELWDSCVRELLYEENGSIPYFNGIEQIIKANNISSILDVCAGSGFPSIYLRKKGYDVDCMDISFEAINLFKKNAKKENVNTSIKQGDYKKSKDLFPKTYDFILCRGNSLIYADGGYILTSKNAIKYESDKQKSLSAISDVVKNFHSQLNKGGLLYIDKYKDDEIDHFDKVAQVKFLDKNNNIRIDDLYFNINYKENIRNASTTRITKDGKEIIDLCQSYKLTGNELENILENTGFIFEKTMVEGEKYFNTWICRK